jgi:ELWxxDGT repeat protein
MNPARLRHRLGRLLQPAKPRRRPPGRPVVERLEGRALLAAVPQLIANMNDAPAWSSQDRPEFTSVGEVAYFAADDPVAGRELWVTDGTAAGTRLLADLVPGISGSNPQSLVPFRGGLAFVARDASGDWKVWTTDGTAANTKPLTAALGQEYYTPPGQLTVAGDTLFFRGSQRDIWAALWRSDGTAAGTTRVTDFAVDRLTAVGDTLFFTAYTDSTGSGELWRSDGTPGGTVLVKDINPGDSGSNADQLTAAGNKLYFTADDGVHGRALWVSDGTSFGTQLVVAEDFGPSSSGQSQLAALGNSVIFTLRQGDQINVYANGGSPASTRLLHSFSDPDRSTRLGFMTEANGSLYFTEDAGNKTQVWRTDGTSAGTNTPGPFTWHASADSTTKGFGRLGDGFYFILANDANFDSTYLYLYNPTTSRFTSAVDLDHQEVGWSGVVGKRVIYLQVKEGEGPALWSSDGTAAGTRLIQRFGRGDGSLIDRSAWGPPFVPQGDDVLFVAENGSTNFRVPWRTDGTPAGTVPLQNPASPDAYAYVDRLVSFGGLAYFDSREPSTGRELWVTDGTVAGTHPFLDLVPGPESSGAWPLAVLGDLLLFTAYDGVSSIGLWRTDGTAAGTTMLAAFPSTPTGSFVRPRMAVAGDSLYFVLNGDFEQGDLLWKTDGTAAGTGMVADVRPGPESAFIESMVAAGDRLYFSTDDGIHGLELWTSDGTAEGTHLVTDLNPGPEYAGVWSMAALGDLLYFAGWDGVHSGLWRTDGTAEGTTLVYAGPDGKGFITSNLFAMGDRLYFGGSDSTDGHELWTSDGTAGGTHLVKNIEPGSEGSSPESFTSLDGILYFVARNARRGRELWRSDGTEAGTWLVADIFPGVDESAPAGLTAHAGALYFTADDGRHGREPWVFVPDGPAPARPAADLDGDRRGDLVTYRPDTSEFFVRYADGRTERIAFGPGSAYTGASTPPVGVATDVDLDGKTDLTVYRPDTSEFFVRYADGRTERIAFGPGSAYTGAAVPPAPIVADIDFSGAAEMVVYRPDTSEFFVRYADGRAERIAFGPGSAYTGAATPPVGLAADLDGDGAAELVVYRPDTSEFFIRHGDGRAERISFGPGSLWTGAGVPPVPSASDLDGDGRADLVVYRPDTSEFFVRYADGRTERVAFGPGSAYTGAAVPPLPVVNDLDGDGTAELIAYRPDTSEFFARYAGGRTERIAFGPGSAYTGAAVPPSPLPSSVSAWSLLVPLDDDLLLAALGGSGRRNSRAFLAGGSR